MAEITGATFNFNKTVTEDEPASTPDKPADGAKVETKVAGEKKGKSNTKDFINLSIVTQAVKTAINSAISNVEGSQLSAQVGALQTGVTSAISMIHMAKTNPYALLTSLACEAISYKFKVEKYNRQKVWSDFELNEYRSHRGYSNSRTRNN